MRYCLNILYTADNILYTAERGIPMKINKWLSVLLVLAGNVLYALSVKLFVLPANLISCGTTGIALVVNALTGLDISVFIFCFNVVMLALGWWVLGRQFAMTTVLSSLFYPVVLEILDWVLGNPVVTENMLLDVLFAGLGLGLRLHRRYGHSAPAAEEILRHSRFHIPLGV